MTQFDQKKLYREFIAHLEQLSGPKEIEEFLNAILTPKEIEELPRRLQVVKLLKSGMPQREISELLGVGIATVTRGAKVLNSKAFENLES